MRKINLISSIALAMGLIFSENLAAQQKSCCAADPTYAFANFANDPAFMQEHDIPAPYRHESEEGKTIVYDTRDGKTANAFVLLSEKPTDQWLVVVHEWWGLNDHIKKEAEKLFLDIGNINVIAIDLYDGNVATTHEDARTYMQGVKRERSMMIIRGAFEYLGPSAKISTIGWCFGGGWSLQTFIEAGEHAVSCVMYYGMPESDPEKLKTINGPVLGVFANQDGSITPEVVATFQSNMDKASKQLTVKQYDAKHAFANPSSGSYNSEAAQDAYQVVLAFLKQNMR